MHLIPWEVQVDPVTTAFAERRGVAFIGSYGHPPNRDAAELLLDGIMPLVWARDPSLPCLLAGSDLPAGLRAVAERAPGPVVVRGQVPTLGSLWNRVRLSVAPLRFGAGLKGKVIDSIAGGIPCVCSPIAAEGMDLPPALASLVAASPGAAAELILRLHGDEAANGAVATAGLRWVGETFSAARIDAALRAAAFRAGGEGIEPAFQ